MARRHPVLALVCLAMTTGCEEPIVLDRPHLDRVDLSAGTLPPPPKFGVRGLKAPVRVAVGDVRCSAAIAGRPRVVCDFIRERMTTSLAAAPDLRIGNCRPAAFDSTIFGTGGCFGNDLRKAGQDVVPDVVVDVDVVEFDRGVSATGTRTEGGMVVFGATEVESRTGTIAIQVRLIDPATTEVLQSFRCYAGTVDERRQSGVYLAVLQAEGQTRSRSSDALSLAAAVDAVAVQVWERVTTNAGRVPAAGASNE